MTLTWGDDFAVPDEVIPACGVRRMGAYDPRPPQMTLHRTYGQRMSLKNDFEAHEIVIRAFDHAVTISELKYAAAEFRKLDPQLERIVIFLTPENYRENFNALCHLKFDRTLAREDPNSRDFCVVKQCKVKQVAIAEPRRKAELENSSLTGEEKLRAAQLETGTLTLNDAVKGKPMPFESLVSESALLSAG